MTQDEINYASYKLAEKQVIESRLQWQEEQRERAAKSEALAEERDRHYKTIEKHWQIGYGLTVLGILALVYVKLTAS